MMARSRTSTAGRPPVSSSASFHSTMSNDDRYQVRRTNSLEIQEQQQQQQQQRFHQQSSNRSLRRSHHSSSTAAKRRRGKHRTSSKSMDQALTTILQMEKQQQQQQQQQQHDYNKNNRRGSVATASTRRSSTSSTQTTFTSNGNITDKATMLDLIQRLSYHLANSVMEKLVQQIEQQKEEIPTKEQPMSLQQQQQQQQYLDVSSSVRLSRQNSTSFDSSQSTTTSNSSNRYKYTDPVKEIQSLMYEMEQQQQQGCTGSDGARERKMTLEEFEFEMNNSSGTIGYNDGDGGGGDDESDISIDDIDDVNHDSSSSSISVTFSSYDPLAYDVMPLGGDELVQEQDGQSKDRSTKWELTASTISQALSVSQDSTIGNKSNEQVVTKIGQTRLSRILSQRSPCPSVANGKPMWDDSSMMSQTITDRSVDSTKIVQEMANTYIDEGISNVSHYQFQNYNEPHNAAICLIDISGFSNLSRMLDVEELSRTINNYFQIIVDEIQAYDGDILKFAGDALIVEWKEVKQGSKRTSACQTVLKAASCASRIVDKCSDFPVNRDNNKTKDKDDNILISTLNVHCGLGYGNVMATSVGDDSRREYLILGETMKQVADTMAYAKQGEVVASPAAFAMLNELAWIITPTVFENNNETVIQLPQLIASKKDQYFKPKVHDSLTPTPLKIKTGAQSSSWMDKCQNFNLSLLGRLLIIVSSYVHPAVLSKESELASGSSHLTSSDSRSSSRRSSSDTTSNKVSADAELREVFTTFIQPQVDVSRIMGSEVEIDTVVLLNQLMLIVNSEVTRYKGQLRQYIVDDKGLVIIATFGLRGSTFPNMVEERGLPCISNIKTLIKTELELDCRIGATFGKAFCGLVGAMNRHEYAVLGSPVNLAARLMASKQNPGILVDENVILKAAHHPFDSLQPVEAKGYDKPVKIFKPRESIRKSWKCLSSNFVGRNDEMANFANSAKKILKQNRHSEIFFLTGPYGIGKSLLLSHAVNRVKRACTMALKTCHSTCHVFCEEDSFKPFSILRPLFLNLIRGKENTTININSIGSSSRRMSNQSSSRNSRRSSVLTKSSGGSGSFPNSLSSSNHSVSGFSMGKDSIDSHSSSMMTDEELVEEEIDVSLHVDEKMLNLQLLKVCLEAGIPMNYIEVFGGLIFTNKLSDIGSWADRGQKQSEWDQIAHYVVRAFIHMTSKYDLVLLALDEVSGMDEMSWKILEMLYHESKNLMVLCAARSTYDMNIHEEFLSLLTSENNTYFKHCVLQPLEETTTFQLVYKKVGKKRRKLEEEIVQIAATVHILSKGNPLMASEILNKLYLNFTPQEEENLENLGYIGELLMNRLDSLNATVLNYLNLGALLGSSFHLDEVVMIMAKSSNVNGDDLESFANNVRSSLQEAIDSGVLLLSTTKGNLYTFVQKDAGRPFDLDEIVEERMKMYHIPDDERESHVNLVWSLLEDQVDNGTLCKHVFERTTFTFSHEFWEKSIKWRTLDGWKNEMLKIKNELDTMKRIKEALLL